MFYKLLLILIKVVSNIYIIQLHKNAFCYIKNKVFHLCSINNQYNWNVKRTKSTSQFCFSIKKEAMISIVTHLWLQCYFRRTYCNYHLKFLNRIVLTTKYLLHEIWDRYARKKYTQYIKFTYHVFVSNIYSNKWEAIIFVTYE